MKKLLIIMFLFVWSFAFAFDPFNETEEVHNLTDKLCDFILEHEKTLKEEGIPFEELCWTAAYRVKSNSRHAFQLDAETGKRYIFYTLTTGSPVSVYIRNDKTGNRIYLGGPSHKILSFYTCRKTGSYHFEVRGQSSALGIHRSFFSYISKK